MTIRIARSILTADLARLGEELRAIDRAGAAAAVGAGVIVADSSIFGSADYAAATADLRTRALSGAFARLR